MKILMIGAGAVGGYIGGSLALSGQDVTFLCSPSTGALIRREGLALDLPDSREHVQPTVATLVGADPAEKSFELAIIALKVFDTRQVLEDLVASGFTIGTVLCLQNGVEAEGIIGEILGPERVIAGTVTTAVGRPEKNHVVVEKFRGVGISGHNAMAPRLVATFNRAGLNAEWFADPAGMKWSKLLTNLTASALSAILDLPPAVLYGDPKIFRLERRQLREALSVMAGLGARLVDLPGTPVRLFGGVLRYLPARLARGLLAGPIGRARGGKMPSLHVDLHAGRKKSEVRYLNGAVARFAGRVGKAAPVNQALQTVLEEMFAGKIPLDAFAGDPMGLARRFEL